MLGRAARLAANPREEFVTDDIAPGRDDLLAEAFFRDRQGAGEVTGPAGGPALRRLLPRLLTVVAVLLALDLLVCALWPPEALLPWTQNEEAAYTVKVARVCPTRPPRAWCWASRARKS